MKNFQLIILIVFIAAALFGVLVFSGMIPLGNKSNTEGGGGTVVLWGTLDSQAVSVAVDEFNNLNKNFILKYVEKKPETFDQDLLEALASGQGPDIFFLPNDLIYHYSNRITVIPYQSFPLSVFKTSFAGAGEVFLTSKGVLAFPLFIDPMVMYYNRTILDANNIVSPPADWQELQSLVPVLTKKDPNKKIIKSATAMGQFSNITHAKDIIAGLFMQVGNPIITEKDGFYHSVINDNFVGASLGPVLSFYTDFANPLSNFYSWNKSLPESINAFSSEDLAFYFGYASELPSLINRNPNENFLATSFPQTKGSKGKATMSKVTGVAVSSFSKNPVSAFTVASLMATGDFPKKLSLALSLVPARRDLLADKPADAYFPVFYSSALFAKSWIDPSSDDTDFIFKGMVENVLSGNRTADDSIGDASSKMGLLLVK